VWLLLWFYHLRRRFGVGECSERMKARLPFRACSHVTWSETWKRNRVIIVLILFDLYSVLLHTHISVLDHLTLVWLYTIQFYILVWLPSDSWWGMEMDTNRLGVEVKWPCLGLTEAHCKYFNQNTSSKVSWMRCALTGTPLGTKWHETPYAVTFREIKIE
jgi:hypothetical protein